MARPSGHAELVGGVHQTAGSARILGAHPGDAEAGQRSEARPWPAPMSTIGSATPAR